MKDQNNKIVPVDTFEAKLKNQKFTDLSEVFLQSPPSFILRGPIYLVLFILISAIIYAFITTVSIKVNGYLTVKGEEYIVQSPVNGTVNLVYQTDNNSVAVNENLLAIYSLTAFSKETSLAQSAGKKSDLQNKYRWLLMFQNKIDRLTADYARKNRIFDLALPKHPAQTGLNTPNLTLNAADSLELSGGGEFGLKYLNLKQSMVQLWQEYNRTAKSATDQELTYRENIRLMEQHFISRQELLNSEQTFNQTKGGMEAVVRNFKAVILTTYQEIYQGIESINAELKQLEREEEALKLLLSGIEISGNSLILKNRYPGVIAEIYIKTSQMVSEGMPLMRVIRDDYPLVGLINLPVSQIGQVAVGQQVAIRYDAFPFQIFGVQQGEIVSISDDVKAVEGYGYAYEVTVAFKNNPKIKLKPGMGGIAEIITGEKRILEIALAPVTKILSYLHGED